MRVWRITRRPYQALDGEGARLNGGRWNCEGVPVVYTSFALSLAALEYLAHVDIEDAPDDLVALEIEVPDDASSDQIGVDDLPKAWNEVEDHPACASFGDLWIRDGRALVLRVPSALIPNESNYLINPRHPDAARVRIVAVHSFSFDPRLLR
jgi:RES domain-containing protein